jgi:hypothetical protein
MFDSEEYRVIKMLIEGNKEKVKDNVELTAVLDTILHKIEGVNEVSLPTSISREDMATVTGLINSIENNIKRYTSAPGGANLLLLETIKKEITQEMVYLSSFRDRFIYELEFLDEVFRKELFSQLVKEISTRDGISITQAEKVVNIEDRYMKIRRDLQSLKIILGNVKTKYSFFEKSLQLIIQSVSVAGKELHNSKLDN